MPNGREASGEARVAVRIGEGAMNASVRIAAEIPADINVVRAMLATRGVVFGIDDVAIEEALAARETWRVVAEGMPPSAPVHGRVELHFQRIEAPRVRIDETGRADYKELGLIENVVEGQVLATLVPPRPGRPGRNVTGMPVPVDEARPARFCSGENVEISPDGSELKAVISGRVVVAADGAIGVSDLLAVPGDVGPETGNIDFLGSVSVGGSVRAGFRVKAAKKITVKGTVEGAILDAGHGIIVEGGVLGGGKAFLQTPGDVIFRHAQDARIYSGGTITAKESMIRVVAVAAHRVVAETGAIVGGSVSAPVVAAAQLGSDAFTRTNVEIGISPRVRLTCTRLETEFQAIRGKLLETREKLFPLVQARKAGKIMESADIAVAKKLEREEIENAVKILKVAAAVINSIHAKEASVEGELAVSGDAYPGVTISSLKEEKTVREKRAGLNVRASEGKLAGVGG